MKNLASVAIVLAFIVAGTGLTSNAQQATKKAPSSNHHASGMQEQMQKMNEMMVNHLGKDDPEFERRFIDMMIPHHEGAIMTAKRVLKESDQPELRKLAEKAIKEQEKGIAELKALRKKLYGE